MQFSCRPRSLLVVAAAVALGQAAALQVRPAASLLSRRGAVGGAAALVGAAAPSPSLAGDFQAPPAGGGASFEDLERARVERERRIAANRKEFDVVVKKVERAAKAEDFEAATDELSLFILGKGRLPEGVDAKEVIQRVRLSYVEFDEPCFDNGQGKMICRGPRSSRAENAYNAFVGVLRGAAPKNVGASGSNGALRGF